MSSRVPGSGDLLAVDGLRTHFYTQDGVVKAVDGVSFSIRHGETLGHRRRVRLREEHHGALGHAPHRAARPDRRGPIRFGGRDLLTLSDEEMRDIRGNAISMIFQEPMTSLNPVYTCGDQIAEAVSLHEGIPRREAAERAVEMLAQVGIPDPERRASEYPHQLSGGMRQRVMIAMALSTNPELLIADEPTTALDVTIQAQILELMKTLRERNRMAIMLITHDLGVIAEMADDVVVMYAGKVVEAAEVTTIFERPHHPYTPGAAGLDPAAGRAAAAPRGHPGRRAEPAEPPDRAASSSAAARTRCRSATPPRRSRRSARATCRAAG